MNIYVGKIPPWLALLFTMLFAFEMFNPSNLGSLDSSVAYHERLPAIHTVLPR